MDETEKNKYQTDSTDTLTPTVEQDLYEQLSALASATGFGQLVDMFSTAAKVLASPENQEKILKSYEDANREELERSREQEEKERKYQERKQKILNEEAKNWASIQRITSQTSVLFNIFNNTEETMKFDFSSWDRSDLSASENEIGPWQHHTFVLHSEIPQRATRRSRFTDSLSHNFIYRSEKFAFEISTEMRIKLSTPLRSHKVQSIGNTTLKCTSAVTRVQSDRPYSFGVTVVLG